MALASARAGFVGGTCRHTNVAQKALQYGVRMAEGGEPEAGEYGR
jgi:hypothetical protein